MVEKPLVRIAELEIDPKRLEEFQALLRKEIEASVANEPGVLALHAVRMAEAPSSIRLLEIYADRDAYEAHLRSAHFLEYKASTADMVRSLRLADAIPIALRAKPG